MSLLAQRKLLAAPQRQGLSLRARRIVRYARLPKAPSRCVRLRKHKLLDTGLILSMLVLRVQYLTALQESG